MIQIDNILKKHKGTRLFEGGFGFEKENIRVNSKGELALTPHPKEFGNKRTHPYITTDFSESQIEIITPVRSSIDEGLGFLETLHDEVSLKLDKEFLWPQSTPAILPKEKDIPVSTFDDEGKESEIYREYLAKQYGKKKQMISGVHVNISFDEEVLLHMYQQEGIVDYSFDEFREALYLKTLRNFKRYRWFLITLLGNSPVVHKTFTDDCVKQLNSFGTDNYQLKGAVSMRNSQCGYRNKESLFLNYNSFEQYKQSLQEAIDQNKIEYAKENYATVRIKSADSTKNITHLEVRLLDLNPFVKYGVDPDHVKIIHQFLLFALLKKETGTFDKEEQSRATQNHETAAASSMNADAQITNDKGESIPLEEALAHIEKEMTELLQDILPENYKQSTETLHNLVSEPTQRPAYRMLQELHEQKFIEWSMQKARVYRAESNEKTYNFYGLESMELSTQLLLREAMMRGIDLEVMDKQENFVRLTKDNRTEYVMQATRTSLDNYSSILLMENKTMTKKVLRSHNISTPSGKEYSEQNKAIADFDLFATKAIVIKPKSTNFGIGITIIKNNTSRDAYVRAVEIAFENDNSILIENFVSGKEYRFFVINDKVEGILHRVPANVTGNGENTVVELIAQKNEDPLRGKGYRTPLEKLSKGEAEEIFLRSQGFDFTTIPNEGETVYLRENSNISTGGDSLDFTDEMHESYKKIAVEASKAMGVKITGLDMMIDNILEPASQDNHSIIEMNFNPAIHIHCHPYKGKNRELNGKILDALGF